MPTKTNEVLIRRVIDAIWNGGDLDVADELFASDYINHNGLIPDIVRGPEAIKISVALYRLAFPNLHIAVEELSIRGDLIVLRWTARRQCPGGLDGDTPSNRRLLTGITRSRVNEGKIAESWTEWDQMVWGRT